jgi:hypothetical protein
LLTDFTKGRALGLISLLLIGSLALAGQDWYLVSMSPGDEAVTLKNFDGYSSYPWMSPLLLVCLAALATSAISSGATRITSLSVGAVGSAAVTLLSALSISRQDLSGVASELEAATGIAASHGVEGGLEGLDIAIQPLAGISVSLFVAMGLLFALAAFTSRNWKAKPTQPSGRTSKPTKDPISLWDEQR